MLVKHSYMLKLSLFWINNNALCAILLMNWIFEKLLFRSVLLGRSTGKHLQSPPSLNVLVRSANVYLHRWPLDIIIVHCVNPSCNICIVCLSKRTPFLGPFLEKSKKQNQLITGSILRNAGVSSRMYATYLCVYICTWKRVLKRVCSHNFRHSMVWNVRIVEKVVNKLRQLAGLAVLAGE